MVWHLACCNTAFLKLNYFADMPDIAWSSAIWPMKETHRDFALIQVVLHHGLFPGRRLITLHFLMPRIAGDRDIRDMERIIHPMPGSQDSARMSSLPSLVTTHLSMVQKGWKHSKMNCAILFAIPWHNPTTAFIHQNWHSCHLLHLKISLQGLAHPMGRSKTPI